MGIDIHPINGTKSFVLKKHSIIKIEVLKSLIFQQLKLSYGTVYPFTVFEFYIPLAKRCNNSDIYRITVLL